jgi:hypothetical protein
LQALPVGWVGERVEHSVTMSPNPTSLPPIEIVTSWVSAVRASSCGGLVPSGTLCGPVMFSVVAALQLTSRNSATPSDCATTDG